MAVNAMLPTTPPATEPPAALAKRMINSFLASAFLDALAQSRLLEMAIRKPSDWRLKSITGIEVAGGMSEMLNLGLTSGYMYVAHQDSYNQATSKHTNVHRFSYSALKFGVGLGESLGGPASGSWVTREMAAGAWIPIIPGARVRGELELDDLVGPFLSITYVSPGVCHLGQKTMSVVLFGLLGMNKNGIQYEMLRFVRKMAALAKNASFTLAFERGSDLYRRDPIAFFRRTGIEWAVSDELVRWRNQLADLVNLNRLISTTTAMGTNWGRVVQPLTATASELNYVCGWVGFPEPAAAL